MNDQYGTDNAYKVEDYYCDPDTLEDSELFYSELDLVNSIEHELELKYEDIRLHL